LHRGNPDGARRHQDACPSVLLSSCHGCSCNLRSRPLATNCPRTRPCFVLNGVTRCTLCASRMGLKYTSHQVLHATPRRCTTRMASPSTSRSAGCARRAGASTSASPRHSWRRPTVRPRLRWRRATCGCGWHGKLAVCVCVCVYECVCL